MIEASTIVSRHVNETTAMHSENDSDKKEKLRQEQAQKRKAGFHMVGALARQAGYAHKEAKGVDFPNKAEHSLTFLGNILSIPVQESLPIEPLLDFTTNNFFTADEPRLQMREVNGSYVPHFDKNTAKDGHEVSNLPDNVWQIQQIRGRTDKGFHFWCENNKGEKKHVILDEQMVVELYMVAQSSVIEEALTTNGTKDQQKVDTLSVDSSLRSPKTQEAFLGMLAGCHAFGNEPNNDHDILEGVTPETLKDASDETGVSNATAIGLADRMKAKIEASAKTPDQKQRALDAIAAIRKRIEDGIQPDGKDIFRLLIIGGEDDMKSKIVKLEAEKSALEAQLNTSGIDQSVKEQLQIQIQEITSTIKGIKDVLSNNQDNLYVRFFNDMSDGRVRPEVAKKLGERLKNISDPAQLFEFKSEDFEDKNSFLHLVVADHFMDKMDNEQKDKATSTIITWFQNNKDKLMLLGAYFALEVIKTMIQTTASKTTT